MRGILNALKNLFLYRKTLFILAKNDFKSRYSGSYLGLIWAIVNPIVTILIYWVVFEFGLRVQTTTSYPYVLWFISGMIPWLFFSDAIINATSTFVSYSYLVKKVIFNISMLPLIKIFSAFFINIIFNVLLLAICASMGYVTSIHIIDILYYNICMICLLTGLSFLTASLNVFFRDTSQIVGILMQVGMWLTPIVWSADIVPYDIKWVFNLNPMFYICEGYRHAILRDTWFFEHWAVTLYFWVVTILIFCIGLFIYKKLKPHFVDVL